jgi:hypothetical protein
MRSRSLPARRPTLCSSLPLYELPAADQTASAFVINLLIEADRVELLAREPKRSMCRVTTAGGSTAARTVSSPPTANTDRRKSTSFVAARPTTQPRLRPTCTSLPARSSLGAAAELGAGVRGLLRHGYSVAGREPEAATGGARYSLRARRVAFAEVRLVPLAYRMGILSTLAAVHLVGLAVPGPNVLFCLTRSKAGVEAARPLSGEEEGDERVPDCRLADHDAPAAIRITGDVSVGMSAVKTLVRAAVVRSRPAAIAVALGDCSVDLGSDRKPRVWPCCWRQSADSALACEPPALPS